MIETKTHDNIYSSFSNFISKNEIKEIKKFRDILRREYYLIDRDTEVKKVYYFLIKLYISGMLTEDYTIYKLTKDFINKNRKRKLKKIKKENVYIIWKCVRQLEKHEFVNLIGEKGKGRSKKKKIEITNKIYFALLCKLLNEYTFYSPESILTIIRKVFPILQQLGVSFLFREEDTEESRPLSVVCERLIYTTHKLKDLEILIENENMLDFLISQNELPPLLKLFIILAYYFSNTKIVTNSEFRSKKYKKILNFFTKETEKMMKRKIKEMKKRYIKYEVAKKLKKIIKYYNKLYKYAKDGIWKEEFENLPSIDFSKS
ncbi:MAG: hypothetical protein QXS37_05145 [Candidatus Aenigmatarchaeota archaeon]